MKLYDYSNAVKLHHGVTQFIAEYTKQTYEEASENNCELIDWIISCINASFEKDTEKQKKQITKFEKLNFEETEG